MRKSILLSLITVGTLFLSGCLWDTTIKQDGGISDITHTKSIEVTSKNGETTKTQETTKAIVHGPQNSKTPAKTDVNIKPDGNLEVVTNTGGSQDVSAIQKVISNANMLDKVVLAGIALCVAGAIALIFTKSFSISLPLFGIGGAMIAGSYLLAQYSGIIFAVALVLGVGYCVYLFWKHNQTIKDNKVQSQANVENIGLIEAIKKYIPADKLQTIFHGGPGQVPLVNAIQSQSTQQLVKDIKNSENL